MANKVGIFSGVFDPVHQGHIAFARMAAQTLGLDTVYFLVEPKPRRKTGVTDIQDRLTMVWLALQDYPELELLTVDEPTFTVKKTLPLLQKKFKNSQLYLLMGTDLFNFVDTWPGYKTLAKKVTFVVGQRTDQHQTGRADIPHHLLITKQAHITSSQIRDRKKAHWWSLVTPEVSRYISLNKLY